MSVSHAPSRYEIRGEIARGGVGVVFEARDRELGRDVALKALLPEHARRTDVVRRFIEEAQIGSQLQHPGIVPVYELTALADGRPLLAMKLVRGRTLAALLAGRRDASAELGRFLAVFERVAETMAYAHARGVVHRDLKPSNVMVGAFGEVQVMDWGLSKVFAEPAPAPEPATAVATIRSGRPGTESLAGAVMGTPAYMPPEQARGEVDSLDERSDVFGLGGILLEILTGAPPFAGESDAAREAAACGALDAAVARLDAATCDEEWRRLARACLAPGRASRPSDAGVVARTAAEIRASIDERARAAELAAAAARARAAEERRARRLTIGLAGAILAALVLAGAGALVVRADRRARETSTTLRVGAALDEAADLLRLARAATSDGVEPWERAVAASRNTVALADDRSAPPDLRSRAAAAARDAEAEAAVAREALARRAAEREMAARLDWIRSAVGDAWDEDKASTAERYATAFREFGVDVDALPVEEAARRVRASGIAAELLAGLERWGGARSRAGGDATAIGEVLGAADRDAWRDRLRRARAARDLDSLNAVAADADASTLSASAIDELAYSFVDAGDLEASCAVLRRALPWHAGDFWIQYDLGRRALRTIPPRLEESLAHLTAALALRPASVPAWVTYGQAKTFHGEPEAALEAFRRAVALGPELAVTHTELGMALRAVGRPDEALAALREALRVGPHDAIARSNLGVLLLERGDVDGSLRECEESIRLAPRYGGAHAHFALALRAKGRGPEATAAARRAVAIDPGNAQAFAILAEILASSGDAAGALDAYRDAVRVGPDAVDLRFNFAQLLRETGRHAESAAEYRECVRREPEAMDCRNMLASAIRDSGDLDGAIAEFRDAIRVGPSDPYAYCNLGGLLAERGEHAEALVLFRVGHELGAATRSWTHPSAAWLADEEAAAAATPRFRELLAGDSEPADPAERFALAWLLVRAGRFAEATDHYALALDADPRRAGDLELGDRRAAACAAARAGEWRRALDWLAADVAAAARRGRAFR